MEVCMHRALLRVNAINLTALLASTMLACFIAVVALCVAPASAHAETPAGSPLAVGAPADVLLGTQTDDEPIAQGEIGTCVWKIDSAGKLTIAPADGNAGSFDFVDPEDSQTAAANKGKIPWKPYRNQILSVEVAEGVAITGNTGAMFDSCINLTSVDVSCLDTSQLTSFGSMFRDCDKLVSVDISMLDASSITDVTSMFCYCYKLESVKLPDFSKAKIVSLATMFQSCQNLTTVDLSTINTSSVKIPGNMFHLCRSLQKVVVGEKWDLPAQWTEYYNTWFKELFRGCDALVGANGTSYADAQVVDASYARVDTPDSPGYFWLAQDEEGGNGQGENSGQGGAQEGGGQGGSGSNGQGGNGEGENGSQGGNGQGENGGQAGNSGQDDNPGGTSAEGGSGSSGTSSQQPGSVSSGEGSSSDGASTSTADGKSGTVTTTGASANTSSAVKAKTSAAQTKALAKQVKRTSIAKAKVKLSRTKYTYNGKVKTPKVTVKLGKKTLKKGRDYKLTYSKGRKKVGTYKVVVTGKGSYKAKVTKKFTIVRKPALKPASTAKSPSASKQAKPTSIAKASAKLSTTTFVYDGKAKTPSVVVKLGKTTLKKDRDYTLTYSKGRVSVGAYNVLITGKGSYTSRLTKSFVVVPPAPQLQSLKAHKNADGSSGFIATWKKTTPLYTGYQVRWSPTIGFEQAGSYSFAGTSPYAKTAMVALRVRTSTWLGKSVYVQMRAYQVTGGKTYYSSWSATKAVALKK